MSQHPPPTSYPPSSSKPPPTSIFHTFHLPTIDDSTYNPRDSPRLMGYLSLFVSSLVNFASCADVDPSLLNQGNPERILSIILGVISFIISGIALLVHHLNVGKMLLTERGSLPEGIILCLLCLIWIWNVGYTTRVGGIAYRALNIYFSGWMCLLISCMTWYELCASMGIFRSGKKPNLTLPGWISLLFSSVVEMTAAFDAHSSLEWESTSHAGWALSSGIVSVLTCSIMLGGNYAKITCLPEFGSQVELYLGFFVVVWWTIGVAVLTQSGTVGATIVGSDGGCPNDEILPGSNLYFALWVCFFASCYVVVQWRGKDEGEGSEEELRRNVVEMRSHLEETEPGIVDVPLN